MTGDRFTISAGAALLAAFLYYTGEVNTLLALLIPVIVHELGHVLALRAANLRIQGVRLEIKGLCIRYYGSASLLAEALVALAGPMAGFVYAFLASCLSGLLPISLLELSVGFSVLLSFFNLLPALPLDGGRITLCLSSLLFGCDAGSKLTGVLSVVSALLLLVLGLRMYFLNKGLSLLAASIWLFINQMEQAPLEKSCGII